MPGMLKKPSILLWLRDLGRSKSENILGISPLDNIVLKAETGPSLRIEFEAR